MFYRLPIQLSSNMSFLGIILFFVDIFIHFFLKVFAFSFIFQFASHLPSHYYCYYFAERPWEITSSRISWVPAVTDWRRDWSQGGFKFGSAGEQVCWETDLKTLTLDSPCLRENILEHGRVIVSTCSWWAGRKEPRVGKRVQYTKYGIEFLEWRAHLSPVGQQLLCTFR